MDGSEEKSVCGLGQSIGISDQNASIQLRLLNSRGLITPYRKGMEVFYRIEANKQIDHAEDLLHALQECHERRVSIDRVLRSATAFTHERRIQIVQVLINGPRTAVDIKEKTGIKPRALQRHLGKLVSRGFVKKNRNLYQLNTPRDPLGKCLMRLVCDPCEKPGLTIKRIVSGGQTGADRAALDAAIACKVPHGGWCPKGRRAEGGPIPEKYSLSETESAEYAERTQANVADSDATLIFSHGPLTGGSLLTQQFAEELEKPCIHINFLESRGEQEICACLCNRFPNLGNAQREGGLVLNVAGPRASGDPQIYEAVYQQMLQLLQ